MPVVIILVCVAVFITGTILAIRSGGLIMRCLQASHWPTTTAMLLEAEDQDLSGAEDTHHRIRVLYTYDVAGTRYEGDLIHPCYGGGSRFSHAHSELLAALQPGQRYRVYHHRDRPDLSMLSSGFHLRSAFPLGLAMQMMLLGGGLLAEYGLDANPGAWLRILFGFNSALILLILLIGSDRFASRITRIPSSRSFLVADEGFPKGTSPIFSRGDRGS